VERDRPPALAQADRDSRATIEASVRHRLAVLESAFSPNSSRSARSQGRRSPETPSPLRTEFQRDRDRIIHCNAFRRLKHKTQVFIAPSGDHYVTRLTHTLEVSQIARTIARALNLNEDLTEAIALGHDLGHTPFGHIGEDELDRLYPQGFHHSRQSLRVVERLEGDGQGLNLTWEVRQGILSHSKPRGDFLDSALPDGLTLEGQICRLSDAVAYLNHDLADAFRAGILANDDLPAAAVNALGGRHSERINTMVGDIVESSWAVSGQAGASLEPPPAITMSPEKSRAVNILREFMFEKVYIPEGATEEGQAARRIIRLLYRHYSEHRDEIPVEFAPVRQRGEQAVVDYVAGMTDLYAIGIAERLEPGIATAFASR
jgi:dGTPase